VSDEVAMGRGQPGDAPVPGTVRLMTPTPIEMPLSAAAGQSSLAELLEERPWLIAAGLLGVLAFFLLLRRRNDST
jgi:LPXTG-motif cell wall-anchored protein